MNKSLDTQPVVESDAQVPSHIVAVGASAGGLEALEELFGALPNHTGAAFVIVQHLSPSFKSLMDELLARHTPMMIRKVEDGELLCPDTIYLMPPKVQMVVSADRLLLSDNDPAAGLSLPIDCFFRSLALDARHRSIAVVLSGTGSDGSRGVQDIHSAGGLVVSQSRETAKFDGMPRATQATGVCDFVLSPSQIADALLKHIGIPTESESDETTVDDSDSALESLFRLMHKHSGVEFSQYKINTIKRRIDRRMGFRQLTSLREYVEVLESEPEELTQLHDDLLIRVTNFFRDPAAWDSLVESSISRIFEEADDGEEIRVWVAGCATGEEAYTVAMLLIEQQQVVDKCLTLRVFATDIRRDSMEMAAAGIFPESSLTHCSKARIDRFFHRHGNSFRVSKELRKVIVFAPHDVANDAPFTRLHLICCRNLLIYLQKEIQKKILALFHFGLRTNGVLFMGVSESPADLNQEMDVVSEHWKIYRKRRDIRLPDDLRLSACRQSRAPFDEQQASVSPTKSNNDLHGIYDSLLDEFMPCSLLVNEQRELIHTFGDVKKFMTLPGGRYSNDVANLVHSELRPTLVALLQRAKNSDETLRMEGVGIPVGDEGQSFVVTVRPIDRRPDDLRVWLVVIEADANAIILEDNTTTVSAADLDRAALLESQMQQLKAHLQVTVEQMDTGNEELQATNEELVSTNEELQSTNEELNSVNEELYTVNLEHQNKIQELTEANNDIQNLLRSTDVGTIFLDRGLLIRRFTPAAGKFADLLDHDVGRSIESFAQPFHHPALIDDIRNVLAVGAPIEIETQGREGRHFLLRLLPYMIGNKVDGVVISIIDMTRQQRMRAALERTAAELDELYKSAPVGLAMLDSDCQIQRINGMLCQWTGCQSADVIGKRWRDIDEQVADEIEPRAIEVLMSDAMSVPKDVFINLQGQQRVWVIRASPVNIDETQRFVAIMITDITARKKAEDSLRQRTAELDELYRTVPVGLAAFDSDLRFVRINRHLAEINGPSIDEHLGKNLQEAVPELAANVEPLLRSVLESGQPTELVEISGATPAAPDTLRTWLSIYHPVKLEDDVVGVGAVVTEITELKESEGLLKLRTLELERSNAELEEFGYAASHDLQEPLRTISTYCQVINDDYADRLDGEAIQYLEFVVDATRRMKEQIQGLLEYSRIGRSMDGVGDVDCNELLQHVLKHLATMIEDSGASIEYDEMPTVYGDGNLLHRLFQNLLTNSIKFTEAGKTPRVLIDFTESATHWHFSVSDNGIGIPSGQSERIFQVFQRLHSVTDYPGTGVGLALCKKIVDLHGGQISVEDSKLGGSTFQFSVVKNQS